MDETSSIKTDCRRTVIGVSRAGDLSTWRELHCMMTTQSFTNEISGVRICYNRATKHSYTGINYLTVYTADPWELQNVRKTLRDSGWSLNTIDHIYGQWSEVVPT